MSRPNTANRIHFLDYTRLFAISSVLAGHLFFPAIAALATDPGRHITLQYLAQALLPFCLGGAAGVVVFFFTSGYIITHVLRVESASEFVFKRIFRIYPLFIFAVLLEILAGFYINGMPIPSLAVLVPRLLLVGDFFHTEYALGSVEWSLRIEVLFYAFMALMKGVGVFKKLSRLPTVFLICTLAIYFSKPFPNFSGWSDGYFNLYAPFLFIGAMIYLFEHRLANRGYCVFVCMLVMLNFLLLMPKLHPTWKDSHYAALAFLLFLGAWRFKDHFRSGPVVTLLSNMTYAVYLFHNALWGYFQMFVTWMGVSKPPHSIQAFILLLVFCYAMHRTVERFGIVLGVRVIGKFRARKLRLQTSV